MSKDAFDIIVVGAGHNSLVAAAYLARAGAKVLVLEKNAVAGGGAVSRELTVPGFIHDTHATGAALLQSSPVVTHDELELLSKYGLKFNFPEVTQMTIFADGDTIVWHKDVARTCAGIARYSQKDADAYLAIVQMMGAVLPLVGMTLSRPPVGFGGFVSMLEAMPGGSELLTAMMKSVYEVVIERFEHPKVRIALLRRALDSGCGPEEKGTGLNILFVIAAVHDHLFGVVVGGTQSLTDATVRCIEAHGGELRLNSPVRRVVNENGKARAVELADGTMIKAGRAVIASIHPHLLGDMVAGLAPELVSQARRTTPSSLATAVVHAALDEKPAWIGDSDLVNQTFVVYCVDTLTLDDYRRMCEASRWGVADSHFSAGIVINTNHDPSRAPAGKHTLYAYTFVPYDLNDGGAARWDHYKEDYKAWVLNKIAHYIPNVSGTNIIASAIETPRDMERHSPSFTRGDIMGLGTYNYQFLGMRPTLALSQYRVPGAEGLYLSGPFMHPGGGLTGGGRAVAIRVMEDLKIDETKVLKI